jgi:hypothetical protein
MTSPQRQHSAEVALFRSKVVEDPSGCWLWRGQRDSYGHHRGRPAHRASWELHHGPIAEGLVILHGCDVKGCVNPAHLRPGTTQENAADRKRAAERAAMPRPKVGGFKSDPNAPRTIGIQLRVNAYERALLYFLRGTGEHTSISKAVLELVVREAKERAAAMGVLRVVEGQADHGD